MRALLPKRRQSGLKKRTQAPTPWPVNITDDAQEKKCSSYEGGGSKEG